MGKKKKAKKKNENKRGLMPEVAYVNGPDDVEIGDGLTPYEKLKQKNEKKSKNK